MSLALLAENALPPGRSALGRAWRLSLGAAQWRAAAALGQATGLPLVVSQLLAGRGYATPELAHQLLNPRLEHLPDPATLKDAPQAAALLADALATNTTIAIFGDYDVDGTCATALVTRYLRAVGANPLLYIPDRLTEGYGPTPAAMQALHGQGAQLVVTVDTGTTAYPALHEAARLGLQVIVTDHHQPEAGLPLPPCAALVNPHRSDDTSPLQMLCGSGVAFYVLMALNRELRGRGWFTPERPEPRLTSYLDLVGLATVADVMPLTGPNRTLVARGLQQLGTWQNVGLSALAGVAGGRTLPDAGTLGFQLGPRLNAAGRIESARTALDLLLTEDETAAHHAATVLDDLNRQRRALEQQVLAEALQQALQQNWMEQPALVLSGSGWHPGVVGIVASRLKERLNRPVFVLGEDDNGHLKGSARSLPGLDVGQAVHAAKPYLLSGGGHAMAAGVTLQKANLAAFTRALQNHIQNQIEANPAFDPAIPLSHRLLPPLSLEATLAPASVTPQLAETLRQLAPFGNGHPEPLLALNGAVIKHAQTVGSTAEHLKLSVSDATGARLDAICFGVAGTPLETLLRHSAGKPLTLAGHVRQRSFNGRTYVDFQVIDAHPDWQPPSLA